MASLRRLPIGRLAEKAARLRCGAADPADPTVATRFALRYVARRHRGLYEEIAELEARIERLAREAAPELMALDGVGPDTAATLLGAAGDNPGRLRSEASFAHLCGAAPMPASSGKMIRHRLNPGGNHDDAGKLHCIEIYSGASTALCSSIELSLQCRACFLTWSEPTSAYLPTHTAGAMQLSCFDHRCKISTTANIDTTSISSRRLVKR